ncbi:isochorismatase family protein [Oscillatoriales cyanobacterium LEGE 11467]|uniref:Isochorismatase family protein n=1 Tax=Zarconia navalis LEGE 11467 TaxID=1828826 RepID=A0A928Z803_9CYAN|nr:isochorismatase family protein [Zarconia navalis LEGE 11467]
MIDRHHPNAFDDPNFRAAIETTGRQKLILAGCTFDYCCALPALNLSAEGYDVYAVVDASRKGRECLALLNYMRDESQEVIFCF